MNPMKIREVLALVAVTVACNTNAAIKVVYGDNPADEMNLENVLEIKNTYETQIAEMQILHKQEATEIQSENERRLKEEQAKNAALIAKKEEELAKFRKEQAEEEAKRKAIPSDYNLSVDLTKRVIAHIGEMPAALPATSSEGVDAPLSAAFNSFVPMDWKVYVHQSINDRDSISWLAEKTNWVAALYQVGVRYNYTFDINWNEKWVLVNRSDLRFGMSSAERPKIQVVGSDVPPGTEGYMLIDGKVIKVRRADR